MLISYPLLSTRQAAAQAIAASGVSDIDDDPPPASRSAETWRSISRPLGYPRSELGCPDCNARVVRASGCLFCPVCGWGKCG